MLICIPDVLTKDQVKAFRAKMDASEWVDGRATAGAQSGEAKHNTQLPDGSPLARELGDVILGELWSNALFLSSALPLKIYPPLFNRYAETDSFGAHVDNAIRPVRGTPVRIRTDLSCTLFLAEPDEYDGGELIIETPFGGQEVKLEAGGMVLYPSTSLHQVTAVTRGARVASFFWLQSMVRDEGQRTLLFDLDQSIQRLAQERGHGDREVIALTAVYHNLIRRWADA